MKIEKLNENKIRVLLSIDDLKESNIDFHSFMSYSPETNDLFLSILDLAERKIGFDTNNYKVSIESIYLNNGLFVLNVTRFKNNLSIKPPLDSILSNDSSCSSNLYVFNSIDDFLDFYSTIKTYSFFKNLEKYKYSLFLAGKQCYLCLDFDALNLKQFNSFFCLLSEFSVCIKDSSTDKNLLENSSCIADNVYFK